MESDKLPRRRVRSKNIFEVFYGFGDASADGACLNHQRVKRFKLENRVHYRYGHWCTEVSESSSNFRELFNLIEGLEAQARESGLRDVEVIIFTDNSTAEEVFYKGNSTSKRLFSLMLRLRRLEMMGGFILHVVHVAGTRMIAEGADGGSRGDLNQGVMTGESILNHIPLHLNATQRDHKLLAWIQWCWNCDSPELLVLEPEGWFTTGHEEGCFLWLPPPAAGDVVAEQLSEARHKRVTCTHVVLIPRLMTGRWRRMLIKEADLWFEIPAGTSF